MKDEEVYSRLHPSLRHVLASWMRWEDLRSIQKKTVQAFESGSDLLIISPTAGGKSEAAFIPVLDWIIRNGGHNPVCLYVAPLKALINDMAGRLFQVLTPLHYDLLVCHGDAPPPEYDRSDSPVIILTTPESLMVLLYRRDFSLLSSIRFCVIDELHALAGTERGSQILTALSRIEEKTGNQITRIGLSATIGNPDTVLEWFRGSSKGILVQEERQPGNHEFHFYPGISADLQDILCRDLAGKRSLVFAGSRKETEILASSLKKILPAVFVHHSSLSSDTREKTEMITRQGLPFTILCTSTLELGIDIGVLDQVVQIGSPFSVSSFLQRLGRTGRRGETPVMYCFTKDPEDTCHTLSALMSAYSGEVEPVIPVRYPYNLLVREILLLVLALHRVSVTGIALLLQKKPYKWISKLCLIEILTHLIDNGWVSRDGVLLIPGPASEQLRSRSGLLFSLIRDAPSVSVITRDGEEVGNVPFDLQGKGEFLLGGNAWEGIDSDERETLMVCPSKKLAPAPSWVGSTGEVSRLILSGVRTLVSGKQIPFPVPDQVQEKLQMFCDGFPKGLPDNALSVRHDKNKTTLYTFLGKQWNQILGDFIGHTLTCRCRGYDLYSVTFSGVIPLDSISHSLQLLCESSWEHLAEYIHLPAKINEPDLLPFSCFREQWCVDHLQIPLLIQTLQEMEPLQS